jgi:hypothetical protein
MKRTPLCTYTHLGFLINWIMDERPDLDLTFPEIHQAARLEAIQQQVHRFSQPARSRRSRQCGFRILTLQSPSTRFKAFQSLSRIFFDNTPNLKNGVSEATISAPVAQTGKSAVAIRQERLGSQQVKLFSTK